MFPLGLLDDRARWWRVRLLDPPCHPQDEASAVELGGEPIARLEPEGLGEPSGQLHPAVVVHGHLATSTFACRGWSHWEKETKAMPAPDLRGVLGQ